MNIAGCQKACSSVKTASARPPQALMVLALACCLAVAPAFPVRGQSLLAYYPLDESAGQTAHDASGNGQNPATTYATPLWQPAGGLIGGALLFTPTNQTSVAQEFIYNAPGNIVTNYPFTLAAWIKVSTTQTYTRECVYFGNGSSGANYYALGVAANSGTVANRPTVVSRLLSGPISIYGNAAVTDGQWHHLAGVFSSGTNRTIYVDGISNSVDTVNAFPLTNTFPNRIGLGALTRVNPTDAYDGYLDDAGIWTNGLTSQQIALLNGLGRLQHVGITNSAISSLLAIYNSKAGSVVIGSNTWTYATNLTGVLGSAGTSIVLGENYIVLGADGTGVATPAAVARPLIVPNSAVTLIDELGAYAFGYQLRGQSDQFYPFGWFGYQDSVAGLTCQPYGNQYGQTAYCMTPPLFLGAGLSFQEFYVQFPTNATSLVLTGSTALLTASVGASDGVTFRVYANGNKLLEVVNQTTDAWLPFSLDVSGYAGGNVLLRYEVDCGTNNNNANDYGLWTGRALVVQGVNFTPVTHPAPPPLVLTNLYPVQNNSAAPLSGFAGVDSWKLTNQVASFQYSGPDGMLAYTWQAPQSASDAAMGQISLAAQMTNDTAVPPLPVATNALITWTQPATFQSAGFQTTNQGILLTEKYAVGAVTATVSILGQMVGKSLVLTLACDQPVIQQFNAGMWGPAIRRRMIQQPDYTDAVHYFADQNLYGSVIPDWTYSAASSLANPLITYTPLSSGVYNNFAERIIYTAAWHQAEVFPNIPNPTSPYRAALANRMVIGMGVDTLTTIANNLTNLAGYGITNCMVICHAWQWAGYDSGYPKFYPCGSGYGGEPAAIYMGAALKNAGMLFALHVNYVDYFTNYPYFSSNDLCLNSQGNLVGGGDVYQESPDAMLRLAATQEPYIATNYDATACYLDVHTADAPWGQVDYRASSTNAGMFHENWNQTRQLFNYERTTHNGPVFGEGANHWYWSGCLDAVEAQYNNLGYPGDDGFNIPLLVDFSLLKIHPLQFNHGQYLNRWWPPSYNTNVFFTDLNGSIPQVVLDQDRMQKVIFGLAGYLGCWREYTNIPIAWLEYHLLTPVTAQYGNYRPVSILYYDGTNWVDADAILKSHVNVYRAQVTYENGLLITVNSDTNKLTVGNWTLPQYGWLAQGAGLTNTGTMLRQGIMTDSADTGTSLFVNARDAGDDDFGFTTAMYNSDLNTNGTVVAFGDVHTDGSVWVWWDGSRTNWVLQTMPRTRNFTLQFNAARFGSPSVVTCTGGTAGQVTPTVVSNGWWQLPLNHASEYRWSSTNAPQSLGSGAPPVALTAQASPGQLTISWPSAVLGAALCYTTNLSPAVWQPVTNPVVIATNGALMVIIPQGHDNRFFQLRGP